eukprot:343421-Chlamydomonas_euryale.AAC.1
MNVTHRKGVVGTATCNTCHRTRNMSQDITGKGTHERRRNGNMQRVSQNKVLECTAGDSYAFQPWTTNATSAPPRHTHWFSVAKALP